MSDDDLATAAQELRDTMRRNTELETYVARSHRRNVVVSVILAALGIALIVLIFFAAVLLRNDADHADRDEQQIEIATYLTRLSQQVQCNNIYEYRSVRARQDFFAFIAAEIADGGDVDAARAVALQTALQESTAQLRRLNDLCPPPPVPEFVREADQ